jgi:hypothetical protein
VLALISMLERNLAAVIKLPSSGLWHAALRSKSESSQQTFPVLGVGRAQVISTHDHGGEEREILIGRLTAKERARISGKHSVSRIV